MAEIFKIANIDETIIYDLLSASNHVRLISQTIADETSQDGEPVDIKFKTVAKGTKAEIRTDLEKLERLLQRAMDWVNDETEMESVWIHAASDGETEKRGLILNWQRTDTNQGMSDPLMDNAPLIVSDWVINRAPFWEALDADAVDIASTLMLNLTTGAYDNGVNTGHATWANMAYHLGTAPGRIESLIPAIATTTGGNYWQKLWFGIKKIKGVATNWQPNINGAYQAVASYVVSPTTDADAVNNVAHEIRWTGTSEFIPRFSNDLQAGPSDESIRGTYMLLAKMRVADGTTVCRTAAFATWDILSTVTWPVDNLATADVLQDVYVSSNKYHFYEMGIVQIPPESYRFSRRDADSFLWKLRVGIAAGKIAGSGYLYVDHLTLIPMEHFLSITNFQQGGFRSSFVTTDELGNTFGFTQATTGTPLNRYLHELSLNNWTWPVAETGDVLISVAAADITIDDTDSEHVPVGTNEEGYSVGMTFKIIPRYLSYNND